MKVILFGASGMVGQGVLRECLLDDGVSAVLAVGRAPLGQSHPKLTEIVHPDLLDLAPIADRLSGFDACFYCLGVSSTGVSEADYTRITHDYTVAAGRVLAERNPDMVFVYVSGQGTDSTEQGRSMWARVKGRTENALFAMPLTAYAFRPAFIRPLHGIKSKTKLYRVLYAIVAPITPLIQKIAPGSMTTTEQIGRAMLAVARNRPAGRVFGTTEINAQ